jgi:hypothetical protein
MLSGIEEFTSARFRRRVVERDGFGEMARGGDSS